MWWCNNCTGYMWEQICPHCGDSLEYFDSEQGYSNEERRNG